MVDLYLVLFAFFMGAVPLLLFCWLYYDYQKAKIERLQLDLDRWKSLYENQIESHQVQLDLLESEASSSPGVEMTDYVELSSSSMKKLAQMITDDLTERIEFLLDHMEERLSK